MPRTTDADAHLSCRPADAEAASSQHRGDPPLPLQPTADETAARERREEPSRSSTGEDVARLAEALRAAKRAHSMALAELRQADADPVEDWAVWYAEYLLGVR